MARIAPGIDRRGSGLRLRIGWKGEIIEETIEGNGDAAHVRQVIKRRELLLSRLRVGLPIFEDDGDTLSLIANQYFDSLDVKDSTFSGYKALWKQHWLPVFGNLTATTITTPMIRERLSKMRVSSKTKRNALSVLSCIMLHADANPCPCAPIRIKRDQKADIDRYRPSEWEALSQRLDGQNRLFFTLLRATGLRPGEALALEWSDYDGEQISVSKQVVRGRLVNSTKTSVKRRVYLPQWARPILDNHSSRFAGGPIFINLSGDRYSDTKVFSKAWKKAHRLARVPYRIPYTLRHTRAAELMSQGAQPALAAKQLGHSVTMFLSVYSEFIEEYSGQDLSVLEGRSIKNCVDSV